MIDLADRVVRSRVDDTAVLFHLDDRRLHFLNDTAEAVWDGLVLGESPETTTEQLAHRFDASPEIVRSDIHTMIERLRRDGIVVDESSASRGLDLATPGPRIPARLRPRDGARHWPPTGSYQALDATVRIETEDEAIGDLVARALAPLWSDRPAEWAIRAQQCDRGRYEITVREAEPVLVGDRVAAVIRVLGEVNGAAVESVEDHLVLHAAAVVAGDRSLVLPAGPDHGKSTLVAGLVRDGFAYLTDEAAAISGAGICRPYPKPIALDPGSFAVHPDLAPAPRSGLAGDLDSRFWSVDPRRLGSVGTAAPVAAIVFPHWVSGAETSVTRCPPRDCLPALVGEAFDFGVGGQPVFEIVCDLATRVPAWRLVYGDGDDAVRTVRNLLADLAPAV